jgi:aminobenzoyl-glutamate transport protein
VIVEEDVGINSLVSVEGVRFIFSSFVNNFAEFSVVAVVFIAMLGAGVAEEAGLLGSLIRRLVRSAPRWALTFMLVLVGVISSVASDAGYLILIPLAAAAFAASAGIRWPGSRPVSQAWPRSSWSTSPSRRPTR